MAGVAASVELSIKATQTGAADLSRAQASVNISKALEFTAGTAATTQANILYSKTRTLAASANEDLDLAGALADALGATIASAEIVLIYIAAASGNTNNVNVSRPASNGFIGPFLAAGDGLKIEPGMFTILASRNGWAVTAGTGDLINVANSAAGSSVSYDVVVIGRTVAA